jgi:hypothetical protein
VTQGSTLTGPSLVWDPSPLGKTGRQRLRTLATMPAAALNEAWSASSIADWLPLEARPVPWLKSGWTFDTLALASGRSLPFFPLTRTRGRVRWNWPLRVGFLPQDVWFRDEVYREVRGTVAALTEPEVGPSRCDLLLIPGTASRAVEELENTDFVSDAMFTTVLDVTRETPELDLLDTLAQRASSQGAALVRVPSTRPEWFRSFITHLSHAEPLLSCLRWAGGASGVFATPELAELPPLPTADIRSDPSDAGGRCGVGREGGADQAP